DSLIRGCVRLLCLLCSRYRTNEQAGLVVRSAPHVKRWPLTASVKRSTRRESLPYWQATQQRTLLPPPRCGYTQVGCSTPMRVDGGQNGRWFPNVLDGVSSPTIAHLYPRTTETVSRSRLRSRRAL